MELEQFLTWLVAGGGAAVAVYALFEMIPWLAKMTPKTKRFMTLAASAVLAFLAFGLSVGFGYNDDPGTTQAWVEALFAIGFVVFGGSQALHAGRQL